MARRVLLVARQFPPIGGAGVQRSTGYARLLPACGYEPTVLTGPAEYTDRFNPQDPGLLTSLAPGTAVHRLKGPEPPGHTGARERLDRLLQRPAPWTTWWVRHAAEVGCRVGAGADILLVSCNPYQTAEAGARIARHLDIPWIADLEDPWALDEMRVHPTAAHHRRDLRRMRESLATASGVIFCADEAVRRMREAMPEFADRPVVSVPIGFDRDDFRAAPAPRGDALRILHTGTIHTELGVRHRRSRRARRLLRGNAIDVDILTRSHVFLLEAIDRVLADDPELVGRIELLLVGDLTAGDRAAIGDRAYVQAPGPLPHAESVALMRSADLLFLPMHDLPPGQNAGLVPYKTYEYLAAERPILAAVPEGDARNMLGRVAHATLVRPGDVDAMAAAIRAWADRGRVDRVAEGIDSEVVASLERRRSVATVAEVMDGVLRYDAGAPRRRAARSRWRSRSSRTRAPSGQRGSRPTAAAP